VQALPSLHEVDEGTFVMVQDGVPLHVCVRQAVDVQVTVVPSHVPLLQMSLYVHALLSLQAAPFLVGSPTHSQKPSAHLATPHGPHDGLSVERQNAFAAGEARTTNTPMTEASTV